MAKLFDINADLVKDQVSAAPHVYIQRIVQVLNTISPAHKGFVESLRDMLSDSIPMVVANAVAALSEISLYSGPEDFQLNSATVNKLLAALSQCTECVVACTLLPHLMLLSASIGVI